MRGSSGRAGGAVSDGGRAGRSRRARRLGRSLVVAGLTGVLGIAVLAGCSGTTIGHGVPGLTVGPVGEPGSRASSAGPTSGPASSAPTSDPASTGPSGSTAPPIDPGAEKVTVGNLTIPVPHGYAAKDQTSSYACLSSAAISCGLAIYYIGALGKTGAVHAPYTDTAYPWWTGSDVPVCHGAADPDDDFAPITDSKALYDDYAKVGSKRAQFGIWQLTCENSSYDQQLRSWWLPVSKVYLIERYAGEEQSAIIDSVLRSAEWS